jgi:hypothetical protein
LSELIRLGNRLNILQSLPFDPAFAAAKDSGPGIQVLRLSFAKPSGNEHTGQ